MPLNFIIPIEPQGKKVPRITRNGNFKDPETRAAMEAVAATVRQQYQGEPLDGPLRVRILAYRTRPKTKKNEIYADTKPDYDNVEKLIGDALEGILWVNDSRIVDGRCLKLYAPKDKPGWIEITVDRLSQQHGVASGWGPGAGGGDKSSAAGHPSKSGHFLQMPARPREPNGQFSPQLQYRNGDGYKHRCSAIDSCRGLRRPANDGASGQHNARAEGQLQ